MKILICNKYFFINGGTDSYFKALMEEIQKRGNESVPFSVNYQNSWDSSYKKYFLPPPSAPDEVQLESIRLSPLTCLRLIDRSLYSFEARYRLGKLLADAGPVQIAYLLNIYNYMSPSIIHTIKRRNIPVVMRLGDYNILCPNYQFLRNGKPCTKCIRGNFLHGLRHVCVKKNLAASAVRVFSMMLHAWLGVYRHIDAFVVTCRFMRECLVQGGYPDDKIHLIPSPVVSEMAESAEEKRDYIIYFGRISYEKGIDILIRAFQRLEGHYRLKIAGRSYDGEQERLESMIQPKYRSRIEFCGFVESEELAEIVSRALLSVTPSRWYDNAPLSVHESMMCGTPVAGARNGGIPEQIVDGVTGRLFEPDSEDDLCRVLQEMLQDTKRLKEMGAAGRRSVIADNSIEKHTTELLELFTRLLEAKS